MELEIVVQMVGRGNPKIQLNLIESFVISSVLYKHSIKYHMIIFGENSDNNFLML